MRISSNEISIKIDYESVVILHSHLKPNIFTFFNYYSLHLNIFYF